MSHQSNQGHTLKHVTNVCLHLHRRTLLQTQRLAWWIQQHQHALLRRPTHRRKQVGLSKRIHLQA